MIIILSATSCRIFCHANLSHTQGAMTVENEKNIYMKDKIRTPYTFVGRMKI